MPAQFIASAQQAALTATDQDAHVNLHIAAICELSESWLATPDDEKDCGIPDTIARHESALKNLGLNQADIYSFVNRAAVPAEID